MRSVNAAGIALIKSFESFRSLPYQDEDGIWTIGYGHTKGVTRCMPAITEWQGEDFLKQDLLDAQAAVDRYVTVTLNDNQYAALVSLVFNVGPQPLKRTLGTMLNDQNYTGTADEFLRWRLANGLISDGLVRRREAERALFLTPDEDSNTDEEPATHNID
jgi:lysozyme